MSIKLSDIEREAAEAAGLIRSEWFGARDQAQPAATAALTTTEVPPMTDTTITPAVGGTSAPDAQVPATPQTWIALLHHNLATFTAVAGRFLPRLERIATDPKLDAAVTAILDAADAGVAAEVFTFITSALQAEAAKKTTTPPAADSTAQPAPANG